LSRRPRAVGIYVLPLGGSPFVPVWTIGAAMALEKYEISQDALLGYAA
jgi:hypothetical protein